MPSVSRTSIFVRRAFWVIGGVIVSVVLVMGMTLASLTEETNRAATQDQMSRLESAVANELTRAKAELAIIASGDAGRGGMRADERNSITFTADQLRSAWHHFGFVSAHFLNIRGQHVAGVEFGQPAGAAGFRHLQALVSHLLSAAVESVARQSPASELASPGYEQSLGHAGLIHNGFELAVATVVPVNPASGRMPGFLVALRSLDSATLADIGKRYGLGQITFRSGATGLPAFAVPVADAAGDPIGFLTWDQARPGSAMLPNLLLILMASVLAVLAALGLLVLRLRGLGAAMALDEERAERLASHDHLSGLFNRRSFHERLEEEYGHAERTHAGFALHLIDLDRFKDINDSLGHHAGDVVIREISKRIASTARSVDVVARLGGDEFAILQINTDSVHEAGALAHRIREVLAAPIIIDTVEISMGCSIGIALGPILDVDSKGLMSSADTALYEAKNGGRNRHRFFERGADKTTSLRTLVENELADAIRNDQLELHYQPQVSPDGLRILGVEALVRWRHPVMGLIPPLQFMPIAEQRGLIVPLSKWVLRRACEDGMRWAGLKIAINVSAAQFKQPNFARDLMATVSEAQFPLTRLELELTEGMIVEDEEKAQGAIAELRGHGVSFALDDFGTGYSSLIYLRRFSFDKIKIDRSFLEAIETTGEAAILLHSVVHLGRALGLTVCAEGVESTEQHRFLQAIGCHELQGYRFSRPVPASEIDALLNRSEPFDLAA